MSTENQRLYGFVLLAFFLEMYACTLSVVDFLGVSIIITIIGSALYLDWMESMRPKEIQGPITSRTFSSSYFPSTTSESSESTLRSFVPEVLIPGSAAQQISKLNHDMAMRDQMRRNQE